MTVYFTLFFCAHYTKEKQGVNSWMISTTKLYSWAWSRPLPIPTSPAVSSRIHRLEQEGVIGGYTVVLRHPDAPARVEALISVLVDAATRASFLSMIEQ